MSLMCVYDICLLHTHGIVYDYIVSNHPLITIYVLLRFVES